MLVLLTQSLLPPAYSLLLDPSPLSLCLFYPLKLFRLLPSFFTHLTPYALSIVYLWNFVFVCGPRARAAHLSLPIYLPFCDIPPPQPLGNIAPYPDSDVSPSLLSILVTSIQDERASFFQTCNEFSLFSF